MGARGYEACGFCVSPCILEMCFSWRQSTSYLRCLFNVLTLLSLRVGTDCFLQKLYSCLLLLLGVNLGSGNFSGNLCRAYGENVCQDYGRGQVEKHRATHSGSIGVLSLELGKSLVACLGVQVSSMHVLERCSIMQGTEQVYRGCSEVHVVWYEHMVAVIL
jgi:hypothetical protein